MRTTIVLVSLVALGIATLGLNPLGRSLDPEPLFDPGYGSFQTGMRRQPDGTLLVAALTRMPDVESRMVRWWFADYLNTTEHYRLWHPDDHVWMDWENKQPGRIVGASHLVHEYIGGELNKLRIQFVDPARFLGTDPNDATTFAVCARVGLLDEPVYIAKMCHVVRDMPWGAEMRSRFWLGHVAMREGNDSRPSLLGVVGNFAAARLLSVPRSRGEGLLKHCLEEMGYLADLLPDLYRRERDLAALASP